MSSKRGLLLTLDGIDGVGKSTQIKRLESFLNSQGMVTLCVRDPGSTPIGIRLREILLDSDLTLHRRTEAMLFMASRCEMIESTIRPALATGTTVISDRFLLANVVYQSVGSEQPTVSPVQLWQMGRWANDGLSPDLTILMDMPAESAMQRLDRPADRMEARGLEYLQQVRHGFLRELAHAGGETVIVNADDDLDSVTEAIQLAVAAFLTRSYKLKLGGNV